MPPARPRSYTRAVRGCSNSKRSADWVRIVAALACIFALVAALLPCRLADQPGNAVPLGHPDLAAAALCNDCCYSPDGVKAPALCCLPHAHVFERTTPPGIDPPLHSTSVVALGPQIVVLAMRQPLPAPRPPLLSPVLRI
jgi:hypothetical protein